ncbi:MAG: GIY-YIG nuclease family protein [Candidatus Marinimicrobia bacterium]|nr:GIY-YIG nuclease family protein [Candidatus Neomarinimicrobiota bacterium]
MRQGQAYILECSDGSLYTGITSNLENRLAQHQEGNFWGYTHSRRPLILLWNTDFLDIQDAILLEKQIKNWSRKKKRALINEEWNILHLLSACKNSSHSNNISLYSARDDEDNYQCM